MVILNTRSIKLVNACFAFLILVVSGCRTVAKKPATDNERSVIMGSYGGFTGGTEKTTFRSDGSVWSGQAGVGRDSMVRRLTTNETEFLFNTLESIDFSKLPPFVPGNMNYFLEYRKGSTVLGKFEWSGQLDTTQSEVRKLYPVLSRFMGI